MFEDLGPLRDSIRDVILTSDVDMGMIRLTLRPAREKSFWRMHCRGVSLSCGYGKMQENREVES